MLPPWKSCGTVMSMPREFAQVIVALSVPAHTTPIPLLTYMPVAKRSQRQPKDLPWLVVANGVVITEQSAMCDPTTNAIQWGIAGLVPEAVVVGVREIFSQVTQRNPA
jgi:hypothetical protein